MFTNRLRLVCALLSCTAACDLQTNPASRVDLDVVVSETESNFTTDNETQIQLHEARMVLDTVEFTTEGETHANAGVLPALREVVVPTAYAHPGHSAGGEVVGEMVGRYVVDFMSPGTVVGTATLLTTDYTGANFTFATAETSDVSDADDELVGHTFVLAGLATAGGRTVEFAAYVDQDDDRAIIGLPLDIEVTEDSAVDLGVRFDPVDRFEGDTIFDRIDFVALDTDGDGFVELSESVNTESWAMLRRNLQVHDHYAVEVIR